MISFSSLPRSFWLLIAAAIVCGLIVSSAVSLLQKAGNNGAAPPPSYLEQVMKNVPASISMENMGSLEGVWHAEQDNTEMLLELFKDGRFVWRVNDNRAPTYVLLAHGRYGADEKRIYFEEDLDTAYRPKNSRPFTQHRHLNVGNIALNWQREPQYLTFSFSGEKGQIAENFRRLLEAMSDRDHKLALRYLGKP